MAETAAALLFQKLEQLLHEEARILIGVHDEVNRIKDELQINKCFIKDADMEAEAESTPDSVKEWVNQMREVAFRMEDVVDRYSLKVMERHQRHGLFGVVTGTKEKFKTLIPRHEIASDISKIRTKLDDLRRARETTLNFIQSTPTKINPRRCYIRLGAHFVEESQLVGIDHNKKVLTEWLLSTERKLLTMVVVGPGGIGKTTIVKNVYREKKQSFDFYAWITVSRPHDDDMIFREIIQKIPEKDRNAPANVGIEAMNPVSLREKAKEYLKDRSYLIVFDDVWKSNFWEVVKCAIPCNTRGRVIITTRDEGVADYCRSDSHSPVDVLRVKSLSQHDALKLFRQKAFPFEQQASYPEELNELSKDFVKKCNGVPLNIMAIAGLLSTKNKTSNEWRRVHDQLGSLLQKNPRLERVQQVMSESYNDLPSHLKLCFLYFGLFPEDYSISCMRIIRMWIAEGFVEERDSEYTSMEEFAEGYLAELLRRCLVQVSEVGYDGKPKSCGVHDLMHEFILTKCKEQNFCEVMEVHRTRFDAVGRRLSIHTKNNETADAAMKSAANWKSVRSCFVFDDAKKWQVTKPFFSSFELLIVLDLCDAPRLDNLPEEIGKLLNLKYLSLRNTNIRSVPESVGKLENLQTLDLKQTQVHELPKEVKMLIKLRHLLAYYTNNQHDGLDRLQGVKLKGGLQNLTYLQKLSFLDATNAESIIEELKQLRQLRKLGIIKLKSEYGEALCRAIENMTHLCSLSIGANKNEILHLQSLRNPPVTLQRLYLYGPLETFPNWILKLGHLVRLYLKWSGLKEDPLPYLKDMSKLVKLELFDAYGGQELHFKNGWFICLKVLYLESMPMLKNIKIDEGALPCLEELKIGKCPKMVQVPSDLQNLTSPTLTLHLYGMPDEFINRMRKEDSWIINKIPLVQCSNVDHFANLQN